MSNNAHCKLHFINYCPELSATCPYCRLAELEGENERIGDLYDKLVIQASEDVVATHASWQPAYEQLEAKLKRVEAELTCLDQEYNLDGWQEEDSGVDEATKRIRKALGELE